MPQGFESEADKAKCEWWRAKLLIDGFNAACNIIYASFMKVGDDSMSAILFRTIRSHWGQSSRHLPVLLQGPCYSLKSREVRKG